MTLDGHQQPSPLGVDGTPGPMAGSTPHPAPRPGPPRAPAPPSRPGDESDHRRGHRKDRRECAPNSGSIPESPLVIPGTWRHGNGKQIRGIRLQYGKPNKKGRTRGTFIPATDAARIADQIIDIIEEYGEIE